MTVDLALLVAAVVQAGFPEPQREYRFHPTRKWAFDLCWVDYRVAFEREGFAPGGSPGRHQRAAGYRRDLEKYSEAAILGYAVIRGCARMLRDGTAIGLVIRALEARRDAR